MLYLAFNFKFNIMENKAKIPEDVLLAQEKSKERLVKYSREAYIQSGAKLDPDGGIDEDAYLKWVERQQNLERLEEKFRNIPDQQLRNNLEQFYPKGAEEDAEILSELNRREEARKNAGNN